MSKAEMIRALLVEDDDEDADILRRYMSRLADYTVAVTHVHSAEEALAAISADGFDLVFLDMHLGGADGMDLLDRLKGSCDAPVIVVTGTGDEARAVDAMKAGAYDYLGKDTLTVDLLERAVRYACRRHLLEQERARMVEKLAELSVTDELTSLANRRSLSQRLDEEAKRSARTGRAFAVLMVDLDHFKEVNDRHGHQVGDSVLQQCARTLKENVRGTDFVARYGGEEFCVVLPETSLQGAQHVAEKLREAVANLPHPVPTISVGVAVWQPQVSADELLGQADAALYHAKQHGRDCVAVHGES
jgi:diguanylate cyclase (GGDEF)-like protein